VGLGAKGAALELEAVLPAIWQTSAGLILPAIIAGFPHVARLPGPGRNISANSFNMILHDLIMINHYY
jgi:hypothetical protein